MRVPSFVSPRGRSETLASQRNWPFSMSASETSAQRSSARSLRRYAAASSGARRSGSETISSSGTPARFRSTCDPASPAIAASWIDLPASSSMWMRVRPTRSGAVVAGDFHLQPAARDERLLVLRDLVALRQIRVEVVLAREDRARVHLAVRRESRADAELDGAAVQHRQHARQTEIERVRVVVGRIAVAHRRRREEFRRGAHVHVHFESDHDLVAIVRARPFAHRAASQLGSGWRVCQSVRRW